MPTFKADDVSNEPTGDAPSVSGPTTTEADWLPESKTLAPPAKKTAAKKTTAEKK